MANSKTGLVQKQGNTFFKIPDSIIQKKRSQKSKNDDISFPQNINLKINIMEKNNH